MVMSLVMASVSFAAIDHSSQTFDSFFRVAQSSSASMDARWSAIIKAVNLASSHELLKVVKLADDKEWYVRNAVLVGLDQAGNSMVYDVAKKLITDKSLVVRSAAVDVLSRLKNDTTKKIFSTELQKQYNKNGKASLWIRHQLMRHLVDNYSQSEKKFFVKFLFDDDQKVARLSSKALEKIVQVRFEGNSDLDVVNQWKKYARQQKW